MESGIVVAPNHNLRAETAESLADWRTRSNCREDGAHQILKKTTAVPTELSAEEAAVDLLKRCKKTGPLQKMFLSNWPKARMIWKHVCLPLLDLGQITTSLHFLQQTIHKPREFTECQVAIVSPPTAKFSEVVCN